MITSNALHDDLAFEITIYLFQWSFTMTLFIDNCGRNVYVYGVYSAHEMKYCHIIKPLAPYCTILCSHIIQTLHDNVITWKHFLRYWPFVRHWCPVVSPLRRTVMWTFGEFFVICLNMLFDKQLSCLWIEASQYSCDFTVCNAEYLSWLNKCFTFLRYQTNQL